jgi:hypothetical protein
MRVLVVSLAGLMACGNVLAEGDQGGGRADAASPDATAGGADASPADAAAQPRCDPAADFGIAASLEGLNGPTADEGAFLTEDELTIYFSTRRVKQDLNDWDIYVGTRASRDDAFDVMPLAGVNTTGMQRRPTVSSDGMLLYATTLANGDDISVAEWDGTGFSSLTKVEVLSPLLNSGYPYMLPNGRIYFETDYNPADPDMPLNPTIYSSRRTGGVTEVPQPVLGIDIGPGGEDEMRPVVTPDELTMYFASTRKDSVDIYVTHRSSADEPFGPSERVDSLEPTMPNEYPDWISADGCVLYFTRETVPSSTVSYDIFAATRGAGD